MKAGGSTDGNHQFVRTHTGEQADTAGTGTGVGKGRIP